MDPKQDIVVVHQNGVETYVFQPRFCGSAQQFGLILPVPAKLSAQPTLSKAEVFTNLVELSKPQIVYTTGATNTDAGPSTSVDQPPKKQSSGWSMAAFSGSGAALPTLVLAAFVLALRRRRR